MSPDFKALRGEFPLLERKTYLNSGAYCALANSVRDAFNAYMDDRLAVGANWDVWVMKNEAVRALMAQLLASAPRRDGSYGVGLRRHQFARERARLHRPAQ